MTQPRIIMRLPSLVEFEGTHARSMYPRLGMCNQKWAVGYGSVWDTVEYPELRRMDRYHGGIRYAGRQYTAWYTSTNLWVSYVYFVRGVSNGESWLAK
jgi:hypothetical protein